MTGATNRPRQRIPYDQAAELLRQMYAEQELADGANAPGTRQVHEDNMHVLVRLLIAGTIGDIQARRNAAAAASRTMIEPEAWHQATVDAGHTAIDPAALNTPTGAMQAKHVLCRALLDHPELFPPGLAYHTALALHLSLIGERDTWLTHRSGGSGRAWQVAFAQITSVYYHAGFKFISSLERAAKDLFPKDPSRWEALEQMRKRHNLNEVCQFARETGISDATALRPYSPPFAIHYTMEQLDALGHPAKQSAGSTKKRSK